MQQLPNCDNGVISQRRTPKNLAVAFHPKLFFDQHIKEMTKIAFFHLRNIAFLSMADVGTLTDAFGSIAYCTLTFSACIKMW